MGGRAPSKSTSILIFFFSINVNIYANEKMGIQMIVFKPEKTK